MISISSFSQTYLGNGFTYWGTPDSLGRTCLAIDNNNVNWFGTNSKGVLKYVNNQDFIYYDTLNSPMPSNKVKCIFNDENVIYVGTDSGLVKISNNIFTVYRPSNSGIAYDDVRDIRVYNNKIWVLHNSKISTYDGVNWESFTALNMGLPSNFTFSAIDISNNGKVCIGINKGLCFFENGNWSIDTLINTYISNIIFQNEGLWISNNKMYRYNSGSIDNLDNIINFNVFIGIKGSITKNQNEDIWLKDAVQNALIKINNTGEIKKYFCSQNVKLLNFDNNGSLWLINRSNGDMYTLSEPSDVLAFYSATEFLDINNVRAPYHSFGGMFWDINGASGYEVPKNSGKSSIFTNNLWIGGNDENNILHISAERFRQDGGDFGYGPIMDSSYYYYDGPIWDRVWKINKSEILNHAYNYNTQAYVIPEVIASWPGNGDTTKGQAYFLAPYKDVNGNIKYDPENGDFPLISGDQAVYFIFNDFNSNHTETNGNKLNVEIHGMAYAFNIPTDNAFNHTTFLKYKIYNRSVNNYNNVYIGNFTDLDLGSATDDYIGCDVQRSSFYCYNADDIDGNAYFNTTTGTYSYSPAWAYGHNPPAQSVTFLGSLMPNDGLDNTANIDYGINGYGFGDGIVDNERYGLTRFVYFNNASGIQAVQDPHEGYQYYNYLKGYWKDGKPITFGGNGYDVYDINPPCRFVFPNDSDPLHWGTNYLTPPLYPNSWKEDTSLLHTEIFSNPPDTFEINGVPTIFYTDTFNFCLLPPYITSDTVFAIELPDCPGDRRGLGSVGPINLLSGQMQEYDIAFVWGQDSQAKSTGTYNQLLANIDTIRKYFVLGKTPLGEPFEISYKENIKNKRDARLFPNPTNDNITVVVDNYTTKSRFEIFDLYGRIVYNETINTYSQTYNISPLSNGIYIYRIIDNSEIVKSGKLIVY